MIQGKKAPPISHGEIDVTVFIPTFNADPYLDEILRAIEQQIFEGTFEVLIIDSGSTDKTLEIIDRYPSVRLHSIPNSEFGHGKTRNLAASLARGTYIAFLTHDAIPASPYWLHELISPLGKDGFGAVAVMGKQIPRKNCVPMLKYEIEGVFKRLGPDSGTTLFYSKPSLTSTKDLNELIFYSDVNSATIRNFLIHKIPFQEVSYSEDMAFAEEVITQGYIKAYAPQAAVIHSNDLNLREYGLRTFDEVVGMRKIGKNIPKQNLIKMLGLLFLGALGDSVKIILDNDFVLRNKLYWLTTNPMFHFQKRFFYFKASRVNISDHKTVNKYSLESHRKS